MIGHFFFGFVGADIQKDRTTQTTWHHFTLDKPGSYFVVFKIRANMAVPFGIELRRSNDLWAAKMTSLRTTSIGFGGLAAMLMLSVILWRSLEKRIFRRYVILNFYLFLLNMYVSGTIADVAAMYWPNLGFVAQSAVYLCFA